MAEFNWTVEDIEKAQRDFSNNFMKLDCIRTESYDVAIECMTECIEKKKAIDAQSVKRGKWEICSDGYYPYCSECKTEPESGKMTDYCPHCGAYMGKKK